MRIVRHPSAIPDSARGAAVTVGNFDGVHRGHEAVIGVAAKAARDLGAPLAVVTFEPHPRRFFRPEEPPFQLTPLRSKARRFETLGVDTLLALRFDAAMARVAPGTFIDDVLVQGLAARHLAIGYDFVFGHNRQGNVETLARWAKGAGVGFEVVEPVTGWGETVYSSTNIRACLRDGKPGAAATQLGRCWEIEGRVRQGDKRGRLLGFPTANLALADTVRPALGVYAVWAGIERDGETEWHPGCANLGIRPTVGGTVVGLETHVFDFDRDIYGRLLRVALVEYIRPERKFDGLDRLRDQIARDSQAARELLASIESGDPRAPQ